MSGDACTCPPITSSGKKAPVILAFLAGAGVFLVGVLTGTSLAHASMDKVLNSAPDE
jgi:hypothetical protein